MYLVYGILSNFIILLSPIIILYRLLKGKEDPRRFKEKFCIYDKKNNLKSIWFHAASVGEMMSILPILKRLEKFSKVKKIILTTSTTSSAKIFKNQNFRKTIHKYFPIDTNHLNNKFINFWKPQIAIFVDSEIWPNMIKNLDKYKIPVIILNARITKKSFNNWNIFNKFSNKIFKKITLALPQNIESKKFLKQLGVKNIIDAGNLKYYGEKKKNTKNDLILIKNFRKHKIWCAASTHENEEIFIAKLHKKIKKYEKRLITIIIPRHINRATKIIKDIKKLDLNIIARSSNKKIKKNTDIYLVDTYGESTKFFNLSNVTFVGGSIINHGGQNPLEPARSGNYILNGPNISNFKEIYAFLKKNKISKTSSNFEEMKTIILKKLNSSLSNQNRNKIFKIGNDILNKNIFYLKKYI